MIRIFIIRALSIFTIISLSLTTALPAQAQNKPDPKVLKECESVNKGYDMASFWLWKSAPVSKNRDLAMGEIEKKGLGPGVLLIDCNKIDPKAWKSMKNDYSGIIKSANAELKKIITKYKFLPTVKLTCVKNGKITKIESTNPKCPKGYKELY